MGAGAATCSLPRHQEPRHRCTYRQMRTQERVGVLLPHPSPHPSSGCQTLNYNIVRNAEVAAQEWAPKKPCTKLWAPPGTPHIPEAGDNVPGQRCCQDKAYSKCVLMISVFCARSFFFSLRTQLSREPDPRFCCFIAAQGKSLKLRAFYWSFFIVVCGSAT